MASQNLNQNEEVTKFLDALAHPLRDEIEQLRKNILTSNTELSETIKWNGPNYLFEDNDRITMRIHPPKQIQLVFHRGAKAQEQPADRLITDTSGLLAWKTNDRAVATFKNKEDIILRKADLTRIINDWIKATEVK